MIVKILILIILLLIPFCIGSLLSKGLDSYLIGQCCLWAVFQLLAVPMVCLKLPFSVLLIVFLIATAGLTGFGIWSLIHSSHRPNKMYSSHRNVRWKFSLPSSPIMWTIVLLFIVLVLFQISRYLTGMHLDEDDARWIAEANDAITKNAMYLHNPATGEYIGRPIGEMLKDIYSPWSMYIAFLAYITGIRPAIMAHTIYAPVLLIITYLAYWRIGKQLFKRQAERLIFLLAVAVVITFFSGVYSQGVFTLTRIWQGKAAATAVIIPAIFSQILMIQKEDTRKNWLILVVISWSACLLSGMGIMIALLMTAGYGLYVIVWGRWKRIPYWLACMVPAAVYEILYQLVK